MNNELQGWQIIEGRIGMAETPDPKVSDVIAALEALRPDVDSPFMILETPASEDGQHPNYCQAFADDAGYVCEIRIFNNGGFCHSRSFLPDAEGNIGANEGPFPNLSQAVGLFMGFIANPSVVPMIDPVEWLDVTDEFEPVPA